MCALSMRILRGWLCAEILRSKIIVRTYQRAQAAAQPPSPFYFEETYE
jgi:hypothetical protein